MTQGKTNTRFWITGKFRPLISVQISVSPDLWPAWNMPMKNTALWIWLI